MISVTVLKKITHGIYVILRITFIIVFFIFIAMFEVAFTGNENY